MDYIIYSAGFILLFEFCGIGLTFLLCPRNLEKYSLFLAPFVSLSLFGIFGMYFAEFTTFGSNTYAPWLVLLSGLLNICAFFKKKDRISEILWPFHSDNIFLLVFCAFIYLCISAPFLFKFNGLTTITFANADLPHYAAVSKLLTQYSFLNPPLCVDSGFVNWTAQKAAHFTAYFSLAIPSSLFSVEIYKIPNIILNLFYVFLLPLVYIIGIEIFRYKRFIALIPTVLVGLSYHLLYINYNGFIGQVLGLGLFLSLFFVTIHLFLKRDPDSGFIQYLALTSLLTSGLIICYSPLLLLYYIPICMFLVFLSLYQGSGLYFVKWSLFLVSTILIAFIVSPFAIIQIVNDLVFYNQNFGWDMPIIFPNLAFGIVGNNLLYFNTISDIIISLPICLLFLISLISLYKSEPKTFFISISFTTFFILLYSYFEYKDILSLQFTGESYKAYKLFTYFLPIIILTGLSYFRNLDYNLNKKISKTQLMGFLLLVLILIANIWSATAIIYENYSKAEGISEDIVDLQKITKMENIVSLNIVTSQWWDLRWIYYFLFLDKKLNLKYPSGYPGGNLSSEWTLEDNDPSEIVSTKFDNQETMKINNRFYLSPKIFEAKIDKGWYIIEKKTTNRWRWSGANNDSPQINISSAYNITYFDLNLEYYAAKENNTFSAFLDGEKILDCYNKSFCSNNNIYISKGEHKLIFKPLLSAQITKADPRPLGYNFSNITFYVKNGTQL